MAIQLFNQLYCVAPVDVLEIDLHGSSEAMIESNSLFQKGSYIGQRDAGLSPKTLTPHLLADYLSDSLQNLQSVI
jgi:hypothetical protein